MLSAEKFNHFLRDVEALGRGALRGENPLTSQAEVILSAFVRHTGAAGGAVYMHRDTPAGYQLVVKSDLITAPDTFDGPVPLDVVDRSIDDSAVILCPLSAAMTPHADTLVPIRQARSFVGKLRETSDHAVAYSELSGAQHAFDVFPSVRSQHSVRGVDRFLRWAYDSWRGIPSATDDEVESQDPRDD